MSSLNSEDVTAALTLCTIGFTKYHSIVCEDCGMKLSSVNNFIYHYYIHMDCKPFCCQYCDHTFRNPGNCNRHEKVCRKNKSKSKFEF
jgi:hypothetical protein